MTNEKVTSESEKKMILGRVYRLTNPNCDKCYVGSTKSKYVSIRMAHHRERNRKGWQNYHGLFTNGDPHVEILEEVSYPDGCDWMLREREQFWSDENKENRINVRRCYVSPECKKILRDKTIKKYHQSPRGKLALKKGSIKYKLKDVTVTGLKRAELEKQLQSVIEKQIFYQMEQADEATAAEVPEAIPPEVHQDLSDEV